MNIKMFLAALTLVFAGGCASSGYIKPTIFTDPHNNIPADIPSQFLARYERFVTGKENKEFRKLQTDEERRAFIDKFWVERDPNPATPENEEKDRIDQLIDDIATERFFSGAGLGGLLFRSNGGFRGDMAHVYLLHGEPDAMDVVEGRLFVNMMLWVYVDQRNGSILYAFLFYQRGSIGVYQLFSQDSYQLDPCGAVNEIRTLSQYSYRSFECAPDTYEVLNELQITTGRAGVLDGYMFIWALFNFSQDMSIRHGAALAPPKPASEVARRSGSRVAGEAPQRVGTAGTDFILASCPECKSFVPAELHLRQEFFALSVRRSDIDWRVAGDEASVELKVRVVLYGKDSAPLVLEKSGVVKEDKNRSASEPAGRVNIILLTAEEVAQIPPGNYRASVYVKNLLTGKYNAWITELTK